jgi:hypothetical protein
MAADEFKINPDYATVIGDFPRVGIRPVIDGRERGVRESLEGQIERHPMPEICR